MSPLSPRTRSRAAGAVVAAVLALGVGVLPSIASAAGLAGRTTGTGSVTTGTWGVTAAVTSMSFNTNTAQSTAVTNTGTVASSAESFVVTVSKPFFFTPTMTVFECPVAWVGTTCSGGPGTPVGGTLTAGTTTTVTSTTGLAPGASFYLEVVPAGVFILTTTVTLTPEVTSPGQLRPPVRTNQ